MLSWSVTLASTIKLVRHASGYYCHVIYWAWWPSTDLLTGKPLNYLGITSHSSCISVLHFLEGGGAFMPIYNPVPPPEKKCSLLHSDCALGPHTVAIASVCYAPPITKSWTLPCGRLTDIIVIMRSLYVLHSRRSGDSWPSRIGPTRVLI